MKNYGTTVVTGFNGEKAFQEKLNEYLRGLNKTSKEIDIKYSTQVIDGKLIHSALIVAWA